MANNDERSMANTGSTVVFKERQTTVDHTWIGDQPSAGFVLVKH